MRFKSQQHKSTFRELLMKGVAVDSAPRGYFFERCENQRFP